MKTRNNKQSAVQAVLTIATKGRITFSPPVRKEEQTVHPPPSAEDAGGIGQRLRKRRSDAEGGETGGLRQEEKGQGKVKRGKEQGQGKVKLGKEQGQCQLQSRLTPSRRKRKLAKEDEDWEDSDDDSEWEESGWEDSSGVVGTMPVLRQVRFPAPPADESEEDRRKREQQEEAERKKAWAEWQFAAATERNRIRGEHDRKAVQRELMHRRWLRSLSKTERKKHLRKAKKQESLAALRAEKTLLELHSDLVSALQVGNIDIPRAVSVLKSLRDVVLTQRLLTDQPAVVYTLEKVREFPGSRQVQKLADRLFMSCRVPFMVYEGETFLQAFERSRKNLLEKDARILEEKLGRKADRALKKMQETAGDQVVPGEQPTLPNPIATQDTEAVVPGL
ncbi:uncharacterized protein LOC144908396 isoform X1 [Branchiostoma floridae x Branchiostoma belcheri]